MTWLNHHSIRVHSSFAAPAEAKDVLDGRPVIANNQYGFIAGVHDSDLLIQAVNDSTPLAMVRVRSYGGPCRFRTVPHRAFQNVATVVAKNGKPIKNLDKVDGVKLLTRLDGGILGVVIGSTPVDPTKPKAGASDLIVTSAYDVQHGAPVLHIRELVKDTFNRTVFSPEQVARRDTFDGDPGYWALDGKLDTPVFLYGRLSQALDGRVINGQKYNEYFRLPWSIRIDQSKPDNCDHGPFTTEADIGRIVYAWRSYEESRDPSKAFAVGVVAAHSEVQSRPDHNRLYQDTLCASLPDVLVP